jgi:FkbM family methyltransferase
MGVIYKTYSSIFSRRIFIPIHKRLYLFSLRGLGMLNSENLVISGEKHLLNYLKTKKINTIFDVGANVGQFASLIRKEIPQSYIYSFEPNPKSFAKLEYLTIPNHKVFNIGLGKENSEMILYDYKSDEGSEHAALNKEVITAIHNSDFSETKVQIKRLDSFCAAHDISKIDFLKIDVEGFEHDVLLGCGQFLEQKKIRFIQFEFNTNNLISKTTISDFEKTLKDYNLYRMFQDGLHPLNEEDINFKEIFLFQNIFAELKNQ